MIKITSFTLLLIFAVISGCSDRGTNIPASLGLDQSAPWTSGLHAFSPQLRWQFGNELELIPMWVYIPQVAVDPPLGEARPVPLLILLAPQNGDHFYFANHGLEILLKEMIADGTIQPMLVVCIPSNSAFGGYLYAGGYNFEHNTKVPDSVAPVTGNYDDIIGKDLINYIHFITNSRVLASRQKHGIGGVGIGSYGAFRAALLHDTTFGSITVTDGPLDFDGGAGFGNGLIELFDDALMEQGLLNAPDSIFKTFDSSSAWPLSNMLIGTSLAFSPHDTVIYDRNSSTNLIVWTIDSTKKIIDDSTTLIFPGYTTGGSNYRFKYHLPFTSNGAVYPFIWDNFWMTENLENLLDTARAAGKPGLDSVNIWIATTNQANLNYYQQTQSWISTLTNATYDYPVVVRNYQGVPGNPATGDQYLYDLLREMLIFHSKSFGN